MEIYWYIPSHTDGPHLSTMHRARAASLHYLTQIARAADELGYVGVLVPTGTNCEDAWITASFLAPATRRLRYIVAVRPGQSTPAMTARMAASFDRYSGGRLVVNVVCGGDPVELAGDGVFLDHDTRYDLADEYLEAWTGLLRGQTVDLRGDHVRIEGGQLNYLPLQAPYPPLMCGASSSAGQAFAAKWIDTVLTWGEPPDQVAAKVAEMKAVAASAGRDVRFGIRLHTIVRETSAEAWAAADDLIRYVRDEDIEQSQAVLGRSESEGQKRMVALHHGSRGAPRGESQPVGGCRPRHRRRGHRPGRKHRRGVRPDHGIPRHRHRHLHPLRLPAPGGVLPGRRAALPEAAVRTCDGLSPPRGHPRRLVGGPDAAVESTRSP